MLVSACKHALAHLIFKKLSLGSKCPTPLHSQTSQAFPLTLPPRLTTASSATPSSCPCSCHSAKQLSSDPQLSPCCQVQGYFFPSSRLAALAGVHTSSLKYSSLHFCDPILSQSSPTSLVITSVPFRQLL